MSVFYLDILYAIAYIISIGENKMIHTLKARTNKSQKAMNEIAAIMPDMANLRTHHVAGIGYVVYICLLYTSPSPRDRG